MNTLQLRTLCNEILEEGRKRYDLTLGIVSHIHEGKYEIFAVSSLSGIPYIGDLYELDAVYCRDVYQQRKTIATTDIDHVPGMKLHPLYDVVPIEVYLSSPIVVDDQVWGTLNFTSLKIKKTPFGEEDIRHNELQAKRIAAAIADLD